ncbi:MAG TPA: DMT family transporter [Nocardioidaceae bacterium]|nr:DMT family transporter [Nocardioidaceae bacterium]
MAPVTLLVLAWASTFAAIKVGLDYCPPLLFAGLRSLLGGAAMALVACRSGLPARLRAAWSTYLALAVLNVVLFFGLQTLSLQYLPTGMAAVLIYLQPVLVGLLAWPLLGEHLGVAKVSGLLLGFAGVVTVSASSLRADVPAQGVVLALLSALAWALGTIFLKRRQHSVAYPWAVTGQFLAGGLVLTALGLVAEEPGAIVWAPQLWVALGYAGLVGSALAWALWFWLVRAGEASRAAAYIFFVPLTAIVIGAVVLDEPVTLLTAVGAVLVVAGIYLTNRRPARRTYREPRHTTQGGTRP